MLPYLPRESTWLLLPQYVKCPYAMLKLRQDNYVDIFIGECPPGSELSTSYTCIPCAAGFYKGTNSTICTPCPAGTWASTNGSSCSLCPYGGASKSGSVSFSNCSIQVFHIRNAAVGVLVTSLLGASVFGIFMGLRSWKRSKKQSTQQKVARFVFNWPNAVLLVIRIVEFLQFSSFGFGKGAGWSLPPAIQQIASFLLFDFISIPGGFDVTFWMSAAFALLWLVYYAALYFSLEEKRCVRGNRFISGLLGPTVTILKFGSTIFFLVILKAMSSALACTYDDTKLYAILDAGVSDQRACWVGDHIVIASVAVFILMTYFPLSLWTQHIWQEFGGEKLTIRYPAPYLLLLALGKAVIVFLTQFFTMYTAVYLAAVISVTLGMIILIARGNASNTAAFNLWQGAGFGIACWISVCAASNLIPSIGSLIPLLMLLGGIGVIVVTTIVVTIMRYGPQNAESTNLRMTQVRQHLRGSTVSPSPVDAYAEQPKLSLNESDDVSSQLDEMRRLISLQQQQITELTNKPIS